MYLRRFKWSAVYDPLSECGKSQRRSETGATASVRARTPGSGFCGFGELSAYALAGKSVAIPVGYAHE